MKPEDFQLTMEQELEMRVCSDQICKLKRDDLEALYLKLLQLLLRKENIIKSLINEKVRSGRL